MKMSRILFVVLLLLLILLGSFLIFDTGKSKEAIWTNEVAVENPDRVQYDSKDLSENVLSTVYEKLVQRLYFKPEFSKYPKNVDISEEVEMYRNNKMLIDFVYDKPIKLSINYDSQYVITYEVTKISFGIKDNIEHHIFLEHPIANEKGNKHTVLYSRNYYNEDITINQDIIKLLEKY